VAAAPFVGSHLLVVDERYKDHAADDIAEHGGHHELAHRRALPPAPAAGIYGALTALTTECRNREAPMGRGEPDEHNLRARHLSCGQKPGGEGDQRPGEARAVKGEGNPAPGRPGRRLSCSVYRKGAIPWHGRVPEGAADGAGCGRRPTRWRASIWKSCAVAARED
jgi:hypothetical protein